MRRQTEKAAGAESGGRKGPRLVALGRNRVSAFPVLILVRMDRQAHFLSKRSADEATYGMRLPVRGCHDRFQRGAIALFQEGKDRFGLAACANLVVCGAFGPLRCAAWLWRRRGFVSHHVGRLWANGLVHVELRTFRNNRYLRLLAKALNYVPDPVHSGRTIFES